MIRGLVASVLNRQDPDLAINQRQWLFSGDVRYLHAYPAMQNGPRSLPAPHSWRKNKVQPDDLRIEDYARLAENESKFSEGSIGVGRFIVLDDINVREFRGKRHITVHTLRDRFAGRPRRGLGAVYQYDALAQGSCFSGAIVVTTRAQAETLNTLLPKGEYRIGGARTAGYGLVWLDELGIDEEWWEYGAPPQAIAAEEQFCVTLLSDAILRDPQGSTYTDLVAELRQVYKLPVHCETAFKEVTAVGGFNRKWGMQLPQDLALQAGSVFVVRAEAAITQQQVQALIERGVGERRAEGFGRLALNWQQEGELLLVKLGKEQRDEITTVSLTSRERMIAQRIATRRHRLALDRGLAVAIRDRTQDGAVNVPPNSQLSRVRIIVRSALKARDRSRVVDLFRDDNQNSRALRRNARQKFDRCRLGQSEQAPRLSNWIKELCDNPESIWAGPLARESISLAGVAPEAEQLAEEYALRLIDGVLEELMRQNRKGGQ
jgi:CRISPR-associated protein Csx10